MSPREVSERIHDLEVLLGNPFLTRLDRERIERTIKGLENILAGN